MVSEGTQVKEHRHYSQNACIHSLLFSVPFPHQSIFTFTRENEDLVMEDFLLPEVLEWISCELLEAWVVLVVILAAPTTEGY